MFLLKFLWAVIGHPYVLVFALVAAIALAAYGYFKGIPALIKVVASPVTWLAVVLAVMSLAIVNLKQDNDSLHKQVDNAAQVAVAHDDATKTTEVRHVQQVRRQAENQTIQGAVDHAQPGHAEDDALDAIAAINAGHAADHGKPGAVGVRNDVGASAP